MTGLGFLKDPMKPGNFVWIAIAIGLVFAILAGIAGYDVLCSIFLFYASLLLLLKSADYLVEGSSNIAKYFGVSSIIIGMTVVAFGTSLPELVVSAIANLAGSAGISIGNVVGSNISNICLVLGLAVLLMPIKVDREVFRFDYPFLIGASLLLLILSMSMFFDPPGSGYAIGLADGIIMLALFLLFIYIQVKSVQPHERGEKHSMRERSKLLNNLLLTVGGLTGVIVSAGLLVNSSIAIARFFGIPEIIIGLTIVAVGTSLPELATNVVAALKKKFGIAIGNIVGSNIFNILLIVGTASVIRPIQNIDGMAVLIDMPIMIGLTLVLFILMRTGFALSRKDGVLLLLLYVIYILARVLL
jgi:cation:H+ antiporter